MALVQDIAVALGMSEQDIRRIIFNAPKRYKVYTIPKKSGRGERIIAQPARELKLIQQYLVSEKLSKLPVHSAAMAYVTGKSIRDNAELHRTNRVLLKLDFRDFFNSILFSDLRTVLKRHNFKQIDESEWSQLRNILFWERYSDRKLCLSIGAPSSPFLSNIIMEALDREYFKICRERGVKYSRYADDIILSAAEIDCLLSAEKQIKKTTARCNSPKLTFNEEKRGIFTKAGRRQVTGLVITPDKKISLGRERKRSISAALHHIATGKNSSIDHMAETKGWLSFAHSVEPTFFAAMVRKYAPTVKLIMSTPTKPTSIRRA